MEQRNSSFLTPQNSPLPPLPPLPFSLPTGWNVEEVPRSNGSKSDKYYLEPRTGLKFRSLREVERHLNGERVTRKPKASSLVAYNCPKISTTEEELPPSKVKWDLASPRGDTWNPIIGDTIVSDSLKQEWKKRFMLVMNNETSHGTPTEQENRPQAAENTEQTEAVDGIQEERGLRRSSRSKKVAYHQDFLYH